MALKIENIAQEIKYAFKEKQLVHLQEIDMKAHERQMNIDEAKGKREDMKLQMKLLKEMKADHEQEEENN